MDIPAAYVALVEGSLRFLAISHERGHLIGGLLLYAMVAAWPLTRRHPALPFAVVALAELINESLQAAYYRSLRLDDTLSDLVWTLAVPALLLALTQMIASDRAERGVARPALG
ncbi:MULTISPECIES: hypothetical protein [unclassified Sphingobium]|uniref:hypothetical protein n=1 Tax=unclassified Sphingobium TaxID=2611147 RepID=UPI0022249FA3|nr:MULTISPECIES: hypothetical protein [unclassified Sphingobium]MCW2394368.1 branched-subunit amino acid ABC-type transport system permease component [Sphingobium sp. B8D3B]MCW2417882.1 branched-subunit amino acid ABC-type transport system permease component [Sphingobium sp. B8D3C]